MNQCWITGVGQWELNSYGVSGRQPGGAHDTNQKNKNEKNKIDCNKQGNRIISLEGSIHKETVEANKMLLSENLRNSSVFTLLRKILVLFYMYNRDF